MIDDPRRNKIVMVMEYVSGGTLDDFYQQKGRIPEEQLRQHCHQILLVSWEGSRFMGV